MISIPLAAIHANAPARPPGYVEDVLSKGRVVGEAVEFDDSDYLGLCLKYRGPEAIGFEPTLADLATNFLSAVARFVSAGAPVVSQETYAARRAACEPPNGPPCPYWNPQRAGAAVWAHCRKCGCGRLKLWLATEKCPDTPSRWAG